MTRWTFSGSKIKSATRISPKLSDVNPFAFAPPQLSKWPHVKVPPREYVEYALGQTFEAYNRFYEGVDTLGEGADGGESLNRSGKNGRGKPPPIVRVNGIPFRMHELFEAICTRPMPPERAQEQEQEQIEYFQKIGGDIGFVWDVSGDHPVSDRATARELVRIYNLYLKDLLCQWNTVAQQSLKNLPREAPPGPSVTPKPWICQSRELTWFRDALIMFKLSSCVPDGTGAAGVQSFFQLLHDLWCAEKASHEWLSACAATSKKFKSPPFRPSSWLPAIVEMTFVGKLSDPDEPMRIRKSIEYFLDDEMLDDEMIRFLQDVLQRELTATAHFPPSRYGRRRHEISLVRLLTREAPEGQYPRELMDPDLSSYLSNGALNTLVTAGGEANIHKCKIRTDYVVALRLAHKTVPRLENAVLAVLHKQLVHENILAFLGVVEHKDLGIVTPWHEEGDAFSYLEHDSRRHSHIPTLLQDIIKGLSYLHDAGVIHGDLHGRNVLIATKPNSSTVKAVIADFGYSICDGEQELLASPRISAKEGYRAPELASLLEWPKPASDVFACASTFVELLYGRPLGGPSYCPPLKLTFEGCRGIPSERWRDWDLLIQKMWSDTPTRRPTAHAIQDTIKKIVKPKRTRA